MNRKMLSLQKRKLEVFISNKYSRYYRSSQLKLLDQDAGAVQLQGLDRNQIREKVMK